MIVKNAFDWQSYTDEERAKRGNPFEQLNYSAKLSKSITKGTDKIRKTNPTHGTVFGITAKRLNLKAPEMMGTKNAKTKK